MLVEQSHSLALTPMLVILVVLQEAHTYSMMLAIVPMDYLIMAHCIN